MSARYEIMLGGRLVKHSFDCLPFFTLLALFLLAASAPAQQWGDIKGRIVLDADKAPDPKVLQVNKDQNHCLAKGPINSDALIVDPKTLGVKNVFVWLIPDSMNGKLPVHPALANVPKQKVEVNQPCCMFVPHALCMREGQVLVANNPSPIAHNFHYQSLKNPGDNKIMPAGGKIEITDLKADRIPVMMNCDIHPWMKGWIRVFDHPYYALTDAAGRFEIKQAPAGKLRAVIWHPEVGWVVGDRNGKQIEVAAGQSLDMGDVKMKQP